MKKGCRGKRLLLVSPVVKGGIMGEDFFFRLPTLGLLKVAALTPREWDVTIVDEKVEALDPGADADLVGITAMTPAVKRGYEIADAFRERGIPVVMGGMHPSKMPDEALSHCDAVVVGEAEGLWPRLLSDLERGTLRRIYRHDSYPALEGLPPVDWSLYEGKRYLPVHFVETARGCPHDCEFCSVTNSFGATFRTRPLEEVAAEIASLKPFEGRFILRNVVFFVDDNIVGNRRYARAFFERIADFNLKWLGQASVNAARDPEILRLMQKSGCMGLLVGFETLSEENLRRVGKSFNHPEAYIDVVRRFHDHGIGVDGAFVFGLDGDDEGVFDRTLEFVLRARLDICYMSILTPFPGTALYERLDAEGRIIDRDWSNYTTNTVVFRPGRLTPERLLEGYRSALREAYSLSSIVRRLWGATTKKNFFWPMNIGFRQSVRKASAGAAAHGA